MTVSIALRPLAELAMPNGKYARLATQAGLVVAGTLVLALAAKTKVPLGLVDINLGTLAVMLIGAAYGWRLAVATLLAYMVEGAMGLPVFQGTPERGIGLAYMLGTTGGYLVGYVALAALAGWAAERGWDRNPLKLGATLLAGSALVLALGFVWLLNFMDADKAFAVGVLPFVYGDALKVALAACGVPAIWALIRR